MRASIIIPVWNGADVLPCCLDSIQAQADDGVLEIICVDNASEDSSATVIADRYPGARLLCQPVNLGFAGGVNAGIDAAQGDVLILLNQDCVVQPGWLAALAKALGGQPTLGVAGCTISRPDGTIDHVGAAIRRPNAEGVHLTRAGDGDLQEADFITGAAMAIPRHVVQAIGHFDEGFYPGYYEDADYCYRARRGGFSVACVMGARLIHLAQGKAWQSDTVKYHANHCLARYRFVAKHFDDQETSEFFAAELEAVDGEKYLDRALGRAIAARDLLRQLPDVLQRRCLDLKVPSSAAHRRQLQVGFAQVFRRGHAAAGRLIQIGLVPPAPEEWQAALAQPQEALTVSLPPDPATLKMEKADHEQELRQFEEQERQILRRLYPIGFSCGQSPTRREQLVQRLRHLWRWLTGYNEQLQAELQAVRTARLEYMRQRDLHARIRLAQLARLCLYYREGLERRIELIETLIDYDSR